MKDFSTPYYAVIFTSTLKKNTAEYQNVSKYLEDLAEGHPGYLGFDAAREELGIFISYWKDEESIINWKAQKEHLLAQKRGKEEWYSSFRVRVAKVERDYGM